MLTTKEASLKFDAELVGSDDFAIEGVSDPSTARGSSACLIASEDYLGDLQTSSAQVWVIDKKLFTRLTDDQKHRRSFLLSDRPFYTFVQMVNFFFPPEKAKPLIHSKADVDSSAEVHPTAQIDAFVSIGARAKIGAGAILNSSVWVGEDAVIGDDSHIFAGAKIYPRCVVGKRNVIHSGAVIGSDGFGFTQNQGRHIKIPQVGRAVLHDDVEVGANTTIDRGTLDDTVVGEGTKIDNLVQIGHNCKIGKNGILCAFVGLSGNTTVGDNCLIAGKAATKGHLKIGDRVSIGGDSGISKDIPSNSSVKGYPAQPLNEFLRNQALYLKLPEIYKRLLALEKKNE